MIGYDLDGVVCSDVPWWVTTLPARWRHWTVWLHQATARKLRTPERGVIITGRLEADRARTLRWMDRHGIHSRLYMRQWTLQDPAQLKAQWCAHLGVSVYIESDPAEAAEIRRWLRKYGATTTVAVARKEKQ